MANNNTTNRSSRPLINGCNLFWNFVGWGVSTLAMMLLNRNSGMSEEAQDPDKYRASNVNQIGSPIPVVLGRAVIKEPLVSYYGDFDSTPYTEEYGMHSGLDVRSIIWPLIVGIIVILITPNKVITPAGPGADTDQGNKNNMIVMLILNALLTFFMYLFTRHLGRTTIQKGFKYYLGWQHIICWTGENIGVKRLWMNVYDSSVEESTEKGVWDNNSHVAWKQENLNGVTAHIDNPNMFGGADEGGGFVGDMRFYFGTKTQGKDSWMVSQMTNSNQIPAELKGLTPIYPMFLTCVVPKAYIGKQATLPNMWFEVVNYPSRLSDRSKSTMQERYDKRLQSLLAKVKSFIDLQTMDVKNYMNSQMAKLESKQNTYIDKSDIYVAALKKHDDFYKTYDDKLFAYTKQVSDNTASLNSITANKATDFANLNNELNVLQANKTAELAIKQTKIDNIKSDYAPKKAEVQRDIADAIASGNQQLIADAKQAYTDLVNEETQKLEIATSDYNSAEHYHNDLIAKKQDEINNFDANFDAKKDAFQAQIDDGKDKLAKLASDKNSIDSEFNTATTDRDDAYNDLKDVLQETIDYYPVSGREEFSNQMSLYKRLVDHNVWTLGRLGDDLNPAEAIYEILKNENWGCRYSDDRLDIDSLIDIGTILEEEELGVSCLINSIGSAKNYITKILTHVNGVCYDNPTTGKLTFKLIRKDYDVDSLKQFNTSNCERLEFTRLDWSETKNVVSVAFTDAANKYDESTFSIYDTANEKITHNIEETSADGSYYTTPTNARWLAKTSLLASAYPLSAVNITCNRYGYDLELGEPILVTWTPYGISKQIFRVTDIDYGTLVDGKITITAIEDVYGFEDTKYTYSNGIKWTEADQDPSDIAYYSYLEYPYELTTSLDTYIKAFAARPSVETIYWNIWRLKNNAYNKVSKSSAFSIVGKMVYGFDRQFIDSDEGFEFEALGSGTQELFRYKIQNIDDKPSSYNNQTLTNLISCDGEIMSYNSIEQMTNGHFKLYGVRRGLFDTLPKQHTSESIVYFLDVGQDVGAGEKVCGEGYSVSERFELTTSSSTVEHDFDSTKVNTVTTTRRSERPSIMANLVYGMDSASYTIYDNYYASDEIFSSDILFKFHSRNKFKTFNIIGQESTENIAPESTTKNSIALSCNGKSFEYLHDAVAHGTNNAITTMSIKWSDFCNSMGDKLSDTNEVYMEVRTYDESKQIYSYDSYIQSFNYCVPRIAGIVANSSDVQTYANSLIFENHIVVPDSTVNPSLSIDFRNSPLILVGTPSVNTSGMLSQDDTYYVAFTEAYKLDKIVNGNAVLHKVDLGTGFVARSNFNSKDNNMSAYYQFDASTGSWIDFSIYKN